MHTQTTVRQVKKGEMVRLNKDGRVYTRGDYDRESKSYELSAWDDIGHAIYVRAERKVFVGFDF